MLTSRATANVATARSDVFFGRGRTSGARTAPPRRVDRRASHVPQVWWQEADLAIRADAASELEEGQIEGVRVARARRGGPRPSPSRARPAARAPTFPARPRPAPLSND